MPRVIGWTRYLIILPIIGLRTWSTSKAKRSECEIELLDEHGEEFIDAKRRSIESE